MRKVIVGMFCAGVLASGPVFAHHAAASLGTVTIAQPVMAEGKMLQPGTYELRDTGEHVTPLPGQSADAQTYVEFLSNGTVVAREVAEVMPGAAQAVGTSGGGAARARAQVLKGGEFLRVSVNHGGERYLIHLPLQAK